jgi:hypothetical protein
MKLRMLVVDEVHHLLAGSHREQHAPMNVSTKTVVPTELCVKPNLYAPKKHQNFERSARG